MAKKLDIQTMDDELLRKLISCEICVSLCSRGVTLPCCQVQACRRCATTKVLSTKKCWTCFQTTTTEDFINDMDLRTAVDEMKSNNSCSLKTKLRLMGRANACRLGNQASQQSTKKTSNRNFRKEVITVSHKEQDTIKTRCSNGTTKGPTSHSHNVSKEKRSGLRPIVIDGCNVAFAHGKNKDLSVKGIELVVEYFLNRGHETVVAFLPEDRFDDIEDPVECYTLNQMKSKGHLVCPPSKTYDDRMILDFATNNNGIVVSRDKFRDIYQDTPNYRQVIESETLVPTFIGDSVYFPEDPKGRGGLSLDEFLRF